MLSIPKYPEQYAQHFPTIFYLLCCASQHHVYWFSERGPWVNVTSEAPPAFFHCAEQMPEALNEAAASETLLAGISAQALEPHSPDTHTVEHVGYFDMLRDVLVHSCLWKVHIIGCESPRVPITGRESSSAEAAPSTVRFDSG